MLSGRMRRGELRQIHRDVYSDDLDTPAERIVRDNWAVIVGRLAQERRTQTAQQSSSTTRGSIALSTPNGRDRLAEYRSKAEGVAVEVGAKSADIGRLNDTIGAIFGSRTVTTTSAALRARLAGTPIDQSRLALFGTLAAALALADLAATNTNGAGQPAGWSSIQAYDVP